MRILSFPDPWYQVGFVLTTGVNSAYVLGYSGSIMVPLGWIAGNCLILAAAISMYANVLLADFLLAWLHEIDGKHHIRDLDGHIRLVLISSLHQNGKVPS